MNKLTTITILFFGLMFQTFACDVISPKQVSLAISTNDQEEIHYNALKVLNTAPYTTINNCKMTAAKRNFLMLAVGIENLILTNQNSTYSIADREREHSCRIENSELKSKVTFKEINEELKLKRDLLNSCVVTKVTDFGPKGLQFPADQTGCKITRVSDHSANFTGKYCYFTPDFNSHFSVELEVSSECLTVQGLKDKKITAKDFNAILNFYTSDVSTGQNNNLEAIGGTDIRFSVNPISEVVKPADDFGVKRPVFPAEYVINDIHLAKPSAKFRGREIELNFPFVVDTRCERKCVDGLCSSPCDYATPIVGEHTLEILENGKWEYLTSWYDGAVAPGQWQGILHGVGKGIQKGALPLNTKYRVRIEFKEPNIDFKYFDGDIDRRIFLVNNNIGVISNRGRIGLIPLIHEIVNGQEVPLIHTISQLDFDNSLDGVEKSLRTFQSYLNNKFWPPLYEKVCSTKGKCVDNGKKFLELTAEFTLKASGRKYEMQDVTFKRKSIFGGNYSKKMEVYPSVECGRQ
ncbi:hypothetical protein [Halobacteriovorax sp. HLS]|uniref:hypothetical protein n=1 Tax=Halobacteriovorax sp. HLS TaxID=2234000 RepID=UPI000FD92096|nr:hypothetical protein [Halobacteriovorax sp. HLS]